MTDASGTEHPPDHFYELPPEERLALTRDASLTGKTLLFRWQTLANEASEGWNLRARAAAGKLHGQASVADLGCGMMTLEKFLEPGVRYVPVDVVARDERTLVVDLNAAELPAIQTTALAGLGLLEYLHDVGRLLRRVAQNHEVAIFSYNTLDRFPRTDQRMMHAWVSHYTQEQLERLFVESGFSIEEAEAIDATQILWKLRSTRTA